MVYRNAVNLVMKFKLTVPYFPFWYLLLSWPKKIETTTRTGIQACALSSMHIPVVWRVVVSIFVPRVVLGTIAKVRRSPVKRTEFVWEGGGFSKKSHFRLQMVFCIHIGLRVEA